MQNSTWTPEWKASVLYQMTLRSWTCGDLAKAAGLSKSVVHKYVSGHYNYDTPRLPIEQALGMR